MKRVINWYKVYTTNERILEKNQKLREKEYEENYIKNIIEEYNKFVEIEIIKEEIFYELIYNE